MNHLVRPAERLRGEVRVPSDKSVSHRALMLAAVATGRSRLQGVSAGADVRSTQTVLQRLGVAMHVGRDGTVDVEGGGLRGLRPAAGTLNCGNSGTTMRLLAGILAGQPFETVLSGDASLRRRPMQRVAEPLVAMGARVTSNDGRPPLVIAGGDLRAVTYRTPVASAQVKSCVLLAGLYAAGPTRVIEERATRDHTERLLALMGVEVTRAHEAALEVTVQPSARLEPLSGAPPGDVSSAAYWLTAAALLAGSDVTMPGVSVNPTRRAIIELLVRWGARIQAGEATTELGEPRAELRVRATGERLAGGRLAAADCAEVIDELPLLAAVAPLTAEGVEIRGAGELRVKESDRIDATCAGLRALGAEVEEYPDGLAVRGEQPLRSGSVDARGDHRIAMAFAVAGLAAGVEVVIEGAEAARVSYPGFFADLDRIAGR